MKHFFRKILTRMIPAENDREVAAANAHGGEGVFSLQQGNRLFVPFGKYSHSVGMQVFDRASGEAMVSAFNSLGSQIRGLITNAGVPIFKGHPDVPGRPDTDPAAPAFGWVEDVRVENDGLSLGVKWNGEGRRAIEDAEFRFYSPHWLMKPVPGGLQPVKLLSLGLTNHPRIPVPAIANDNSPTMNPELLKNLLTLLGLAEGASDEEISAAIAKLQERLTTAETAATTAQTEATSAKAEAATAANDLQKVRTDLAAAQGHVTAANDAAKAARTARIETELRVLVETGKLTGAQRDQARTELVAIANDADLTSRLEAMAKADPNLKTSAVTQGLGSAKSQLVTAENDASVRRQDAVATEEAALAKSSPHLSAAQRYDAAWNRASRKNPTLFGRATGAA